MQPQAPFFKIKGAKPGTVEDLPRKVRHVSWVLINDLKRLCLCSFSSRDALPHILDVDSEERFGKVIFHSAKTTLFFC